MPARFIRERVSFRRDQWRFSWLLSYSCGLVLKVVMPGSSQSHR